MFVKFYNLLDYNPEIDTEDSVGESVSHLTGFFYSIIVFFPSVYIEETFNFFNQEQ